MNTFMCMGGGGVFGYKHELVDVPVKHVGKYRYMCGCTIQNDHKS